jgi:hypothetical protein
VLFIFLMAAQSSAPLAPSAETTTMLFDRIRGGVRGSASGGVRSSTCGGVRGISDVGVHVALVLAKLLCDNRPSGHGRRGKGTNRVSCSFLSTICSRTRGRFRHSLSHSSREQLGVAQPTQAAPPDQKSVVRLDRLRPPSRSLYLGVWGGWSRGVGGPAGWVRGAVLAVSRVGPRGKCCSTCHMLSYMNGRLRHMCVCAWGGSGGGRCNFFVLECDYLDALFAG